MAQRVEGKVALITGGASGIGRATALLLASEGAKIVVGDRNADGNQETVRMIEEKGGQAVAVELDVTSASQTELAVEAAVHHFGQLNIMFNNAGTGERTTSLLELSEEEWDRVMAVNTKGVFLGIKYAVLQMRKAGQGGSIINTASIAGIKGFVRHTAYATSKAACIHLTKTAALEFASVNIRINAIAPAFTDTPMVDALLSDSVNPERARLKLAASQPLGRLGTPLEIANAVLFLASDESSFMTGAVVTLDGGQTAQ